MKLKTLVEAQQSLQNLIQIKFDSATTLKLKRIYKPIQAELEIFNETRNELIKNLGVFDPEISNWKLLPENIPAFIEEINKLGEVEIDLVIEKFPRKTLEGKEISVADDINLEFLFEAE
jgi:hypothetical protein